MQKNIHPEYKEMKVACSCGNAFSVHSTYAKNEMHLEICDKCHPFYTGQQKMVDTAGRVERFRQKYAKKSTSAGAKTE